MRGMIGMAGVRGMVTQHRGPNGTTTNVWSSRVRAWEMLARENDALISAT
jgi:hypothetical protein